MVYLHLLDGRIFEASILAVAQPGFHFGGGGGQSSESGPPGITGPSFLKSAASVGPRFLICRYVSMKGG